MGIHNSKGNWMLMGTNSYTPCNDRMLLPRALAEREGLVVL